MSQVTEEEYRRIRRQRELRRKKQEARRRHRRIIYMRRAGALVVAILLVGFIVKGIAAGINFVKKMNEEEPKILVMDVNDKKNSSDDKEKSDTTNDGDNSNVNDSDNVDETNDDDNDGEIDAVDDIDDIDEDNDTVTDDTNNSAIDESLTTEKVTKKLSKYVSQYPAVKTILENRESYPDDIVKLFLNNQETLEFVLAYPQKHDEQTQVNVSAPIAGKIPLYIQWDYMWGYKAYGNNIIAISGCGPTSLAMVATGLLQNTMYTPDYVANFSQQQGYCTKVGTSWELMSVGAASLGLKSTELRLDEKKVAQELQAGHPIICSMGPGDFTKQGHFIVLTDYADGYVNVNDPFSYINTNKPWKFSDISNQIKNLWSFSL